MIKWDYLGFICKQVGKVPNFWMSYEYIRRAGLVSRVEERYQGLADPDTGEWFFPPILNTRDNRLCEDLPHYAGFAYPEGITPSDADFRPLDNQYIYKPVHFLDLEGSKWEVFRKNCRKFTRRIDDWSYRNLEPQDAKQVEDLLIRWADGKTIHDPIVMTEFVLHGMNRWGVFVKDRLIGVNVADYNWRFINYRYCIDDGSPFVQEFMRWVFYTSKFVIELGLEVNDGGNLGIPGLHKFKMKLNPAEVRVVFTTLPEGGQNGGQP